MKHLDFIPASFRQQRARRLLRRRRTQRIALVALALFTWGGWNEARLLTARQKLASLQTACSQQDPIVAEAAVLRSKLDEALTHERVYESALGGVRMYGIIAEVARLAPSSVFLSRMSIKAPPRIEVVTTTAAPLSKDSKSAPDVVLAGLAGVPSDVGRFVAALEDSPLFTEVTLAYARPAEDERGGEMQSFEVGCRLRMFR